MALGVQAGETVMIFGASGGIGHLAVQVAKRMGARVFAVASELQERPRPKASAHTAPKRGTLTGRASAPVASDLSL